MLVTACIPNFSKSTKPSVSGFRTSPPTVNRHSFASSMLGSCIWFRTKKCGTGVIQLLKNSGGISKSRNRRDRTIIPSLPATSSLEASLPQVSGLRTLTPAAAPASCPMKARLEIISLAPKQSPSIWFTSSHHHRIKPSFMRDPFPSDPRRFRKGKDESAWTVASSVCQRTP